MNKRDLERIAAEAMKRRRRKQDSDDETDDERTTKPRFRRQREPETPKSNKRSYDDSDDERLRERKRQQRREKLNRVIVNDIYEDSDDDTEYEDPTIPTSIFSVRTEKDMRKFKAYKAKKQMEEERIRREREREREEWKREMERQQRQHEKELQREREKWKEKYERQKREEEARAEQQRQETRRRMEENIRRFESERRDRRRVPIIELPDEDDDDYQDIPPPRESHSIPASRQEFVRKTPNGNEYVVLSQTHYAPSPYEPQNYERQLDAIRSHDQEITERKRIQAENQKRLIDANEKIIEREYDYRMKRDQINAEKETAIETISRIRDIDSGRNERLRLQLEHEEKMKVMEMNYQIAKERRAAAVILQNLQKPKFLPLNERRERNAQLVREKFIYQALYENNIDPSEYDPVRLCAVLRFHLENESPYYSHSLLWCGVETFDWDQSTGIVHVRFTDGNGSQTDLKIDAKGLYPSLVYNANNEKIMSFYKYGGATTPWNGVNSNQQQSQPEQKNIFQRIFALK